jgi:hypothetical protein
MEFGRRDWPNALDSIISARLSHVYQIRAPRPAKDNIDGGGHRFFSMIKSLWMSTLLCSTKPNTAEISCESLSQSFEKMLHGYLLECEIHMFPVVQTLQLLNAPHRSHRRPGFERGFFDS